MLARIQEFPTGENGWAFTGGKTSRCRQIGNAFPPPVAEAPGRAISDALMREGPPQDVLAQVVHSHALRALSARRGQWVTTSELGDLGLTERQVDRSIEALRRDFEIDVQVVGVLARMRLLGWRPTAGGHARHLPLWAHNVDLAA